MTGHYRLLLPTMWVCTLCFLLCRRWTLYQKQVPTRLDSPAHQGEFWVDLLEGARVRDIMQPERAYHLVDLATPMGEVVQLLARTQQDYFPVVDEERRLVGIFSAGDVRRHLFDAELFPLAIAGDVMTTEVLSVAPEDDLDTALRRFTERNLDELPVIAAPGDPRFLGFLRRRELIAFYNRRTEQLRRARTTNASNR
jgi:CIC family chloride channel protein